MPRFTWILILLATALLAPEKCFAGKWEERERNKAFKILGSAKSQNEIAKAVGCCGVVVPLKDGSWIAIRVVAVYEPSREVSLALDSEGMWFETKKKFSGRLSFYRPGTNEQATIGTFEADFLKTVEEAPTLAEARKGLHYYFGFEPVPPDKVPTFPKASKASKRKGLN